MHARVCPSCSALSETDADRCPNCGERYGRRRLSRLERGAIAVAAAAVAGIAALSLNEDAPSPSADQLTPTATAVLKGVITRSQARSVPLNITRARIEKLLGQAPVKTYEVDAKAQDVEVAKIHPEAARKLEERFGKARGGIIRIPARTFQCLGYRGQPADQVGWAFCLENDNLEYVVTRKPLKMPRAPEVGAR